MKCVVKPAGSGLFFGPWLVDTTCQLWARPNTNSRIDVLANESVLDQIGRIKAPDPWTDLTSRCHLGYTHTYPQMTVKAYPHT